MPRKRQLSKADHSFDAGDLQFVDLIRKQDVIPRAVLCTLARRGVAFRKAEPQRAEKWLDQLSHHPLFKGGEFLFDLLEWEDFMLDGPPPSVVDEANVLALLRQIIKALSSIYGEPVDPELLPEPDSAIDAPSLPPLEPGFYLYRDVVLGAWAYILQSRSHNGGAIE
jgi:hypothetical protein